MKIEIFNGKWSEDVVSNDPDKIYIFGDNDSRSGRGGQAIIRGLPNSVGIRTKKRPNNLGSSFYKDSTYEENIKKILEDILFIKSLSISGKTIVFSNGGYGNGLSKLNVNAPKTFSYLTHLLKYFFGFDNISGKRINKIPSYNEITNAIYVSLKREDRSKYNTIQPTDNSNFRKELLNINSIPDLILNNKKISFIQDVKYKAEEYLLLSFDSLDGFILVSVIDSCDISKIDIEKVSLFEGFSEEFIKKSINEKRKKLYQTYFKFISFIDHNGNMKINNEFFSNYIDDEELKNYTIIGKEFKEPVKELLHEGMLNAPLDVSSYIDNKKTKEQSLEKILKEKNLTGKLTEIKNCLEYSNLYKLESDEYTYFISTKNGIFKNKIKIILTIKNG